MVILLRSLKLSNLDKGGKSPVIIDINLVKYVVQQIRITSNLNTGSLIYTRSITIARYD